MFMCSLTPKFSCKHTTTIAAKPHPKSACLLQRLLDRRRIDLGLAVFVNPRILASNCDFKKDPRGTICAEWKENADGQQFPSDMMGANCVPDRVSKQRKREKASECKGNPENASEDAYDGSNTVVREFAHRWGDLTFVRSRGVEVEQLATASKRATIPPQRARE
jgi:hypothetical protein